MNCIWDIVLRAAQDDIESMKLFFKPAKNFCPYCEQSFKIINQRRVEETEVEINPLARFSNIFEYLLHPDCLNLIYKNQQQFTAYFFDLLTHFLAEIDLCHGMTRREFYVRQIRRELLSGVFGDVAREGMEQLKREKQFAVADELLRVMEVGSSVRSFCHIMKQIFEDCIIYQGRAHPQRIYVYIGQRQTEQLEKQWQLIRETFLAFDFEVRVFWDKHFGIIDVTETMRVDNIAIF
ncbi:MAG: hypothetical protein IKN27_10725 [Selenomonadaceae bacterium]|nr:hypothetical protein [Selenomonadaceae bacterium]